MKIRTITGKYDKTCTVSANLTENQMKRPEIRELIEFAEPRMLSTMIVSGIQSDWQVRNSKKGKTSIGQVDQSNMIGDNAYRYRTMGRIQRKSIIIAQVGTSGTDGSFTLTLRDNLLYPGMVVRLYTGLHARVETEGTGAAGNYVYSFKTVNGTVFDFNTHVAVQPGEYSCFGGYTMYGEGSLRGYSRSFTYDEYVNHLTIQRKSVEMTGSALSDVVWYKVGKAGGWYFEKEKQARLQFMRENEYQKWHGESTMRDSVGNLLTQSRMTDPQTGNPIVAGDGIIEQIRGANDMAPSGTDGFPTIDDYRDMMTQLAKRSDAEFDNMWYVVTGTDGYNSAQDVLRDYWVNYLGGRNTHSGGEDIEVGNFFDTLKINGNKIVFVKNPLWDDEELFSAVGSDGKSVQGGSFLFLNNGAVNGRRNIEILAKGANGVNRSMISNYNNGLTGWADKAMSGSVDAMQYNMLKEDGIFVYNTVACGMIEKPMA